MTKKPIHKLIIGRTEAIDFCDTPLNGIPAKIDTGAYRSAVHAEDITELPDGILSFHLLKNHPLFGSIAKHDPITVDSYKTVRVENSFGHSEDRYEVMLKVKLGSKIITTNFTLANRSKKVFPVLVGRKLLKGRYLVDTSLSSIDRVELKKQYGIIVPQDGGVEDDQLK